MSAHLDDDSAIAAALPTFVTEAQEQTETLEQLLLQLEDAPGDAGLLDALFRCAHTIKGSAGIFGLDAIVAFTHHVETLLERLRDGSLRLTPALSTLLLECNDQVRGLVATAQAPHRADAAGEALRARLVTRLQAACQADAQDAAPAAPPGSAWRIGVRFGANAFRDGMDPLPLLCYLHEMGRVSELACRSAAVPALAEVDPEACHLGFDLVLTTDADRDAIDNAFAFVRDECELSLAPLQPLQPLPSAAAPATAPTAGDEPRHIRVLADRLDDVIDLLGELVVASAGASLQAREARHAGLLEATQQIAQLVENIRNGAMQLRMVPIGDTFARFRRVVRDTAAALGKQVQLEIVGGDTELDKAVVERIVDPLVHLVRNALDHGLETPEQRRAAGKPDQGRLALTASHESGGILIRIEDDGRGIQREKILQRAWDRGLVERGCVPAADEILDLIFEPGFSTAEQVTNLSGRGVGMDVVRRNIEALRGTIVVDSEAGRGAAVEIRLPLTLAIIDGFLVGVGASRFVFPLEAVVEVVEEPAAAAIEREGRGVIDLRGHALPVVNLRSLYALESPPAARASVVVLRSGHHRCGVLVDTLHGQHQTVIKPLSRLFAGLRGICGSTVLGNGAVALIFDVAQLLHLASGQPPTSSTEGKA